MTPLPDLQSTAENRYTISVPRLRASSAMWRSMLVPGAGQRYVGRAFMSNFFNVTVSGSAAGALFAHDAYLGATRDQADAQRRYDAAQSEAEAEGWRRAVAEAAEDAHDMNTWRWCLAGAAGAFYIWNVLDASIRVGSAPDASRLSLSIQPGVDGVQSSLCWRMP
jgi:hypothetical protein